MVSIFPGPQAGPLVIRQISGKLFLAYILQILTNQKKNAAARSLLLFLIIYLGTSTKEPPRLQSSFVFTNVSLLHHLMAVRSESTKTQVSRPVWW